MLCRLGLDKGPQFLADTMLPSTSPEAAAAASVLVNGGFDPFQYVQLPDGYTAAASGASKAYRMFNGSYTWADARQACEADGAQIAMPKTVTDMQDILGRNGTLSEGLCYKDNTDRLLKHMTSISSNTPAMYKSFH